MGKRDKSKPIEAASSSSKNVKKSVNTRLTDFFSLAKDTSLIQNAPGGLIAVCRVNTLCIWRLFSETFIHARHSGLMCFLEIK